MSEMKGKGFIKLRQPILKNLLHHLTDAPVHDLAIFFEQAAINHLLDQGVLKNIFLVRLRRSAYQVKEFELM